MQALDVPAQLCELGIVPVIAIEAVEQALPLADALLAGGIPLIEVTFRTPAAAEVIRTVTRTRPRMLVGAGTVLTQENLKAAVEAGARFAVAPGLNLKIVELARNLNVPFIPGVATASEIELALGAGSRILKFFPAELLGGVNMLNAMFSPYGHTGVRFIPTGGVSPANLEAYLRCPAVAAVGGTWLAKQSDLADNKWDEIRKRCVAAVETVQRVRAEKSE